MCTRGLRPRAIRWVCSAYLKNAHPDGCGRIHDSHLWNYKRIRIPKMRNPKEVQRDIVAYALRARNPEVCEADLLNQHPVGMPAYSPGS